MKLQLSKNTPSDLSTVGRYIATIKGTYMVVTSHFVRYQSKNRGLNLEFKIDSLKEQKDFNASFGISPKINKTLSDLSKGEQKIVICSDEKRKSYLITNKHTNVNLDHVDVKLVMPTISDSIAGAEEIGPQINVSSRHELGITGREKTTNIITRGDTFTSIISSSGEYFFDPDYPEEAETDKTFLKSCFFLKIGKEHFKLQLYRKKNSFLLLTKASIGTGITCRMLETLTSQ